MKILLSLTVNGNDFELLVSPERTLLDVLRRDLGLTGTKENCREAECGVCTVLVDGEAVNSCVLLAVQCRGRRITTVEGLTEDDTLHPLQTAFLKHGAVQCGYCIPGMILTAKAYLDRNPCPTEGQVREALAGVLCRCTGYQKIIAAVLAAAEALAGQQPAPAAVGAPAGAGRASA